MKIIRLNVNNFKRIKAVEIEPGGATVVQIRGKNKQGKSSCLDAIAAALGGERLCPKVPVRRGTDGAVVRVELDEDLVVERRWTADGDSSLRVMTKEGLQFTKPQRRLDDLIGRLSFDPLAFIDLPPKEQAETLRRLAGVDFSELDARRQLRYEARTDANRQVLQLRSRLAALPAVEAPDEPVNSAELLAEQERRSEVRSLNDRKRLELDDVRAKFRRVGDEVAHLRGMIEEAQRQLAKAEARREELRVAGAALKAEVEQLVDPDLQEIPAKVREVEAVNERVRANKARAELARDLEQAEIEAKELDDEIASIDEQKAAQLAQVKFPVSGLTFTAEGVLLDGLPFEQAAQSEQLRISVAIGSALNPKLRAMLVRDGSRLDQDSLALLKEEAARFDLQVWLEQVGKDGEGIVIEDGQVETAAVPAEASAP
jgi:predicted ATP-dependent endonuclease of OLD family